MITTNKQTETMKATLTTTGITVYIRKDLTPQHDWNTGMITVSKQQDSTSTFCVDAKDLKIN